MYALYNSESNEYIGVEHGSDECNMPWQSLVEYSTLDDYQPFMFVVKDINEAKDILNSAKIHYNGSVPIGSSLGEFSCEVPDISNYKIVKISHEGI